MLKVQEIKELIRAIDQSSVDELTYEQNGTKIMIKKNETVVQNVEKTSSPVTTIVSEPTPAPAPVAPAKQEEVVQEKVEPKAAENTHTITSPMVGTFYVAPSPDSDPYVKKGDSVKEETVVCIVEAMKLMNEIEAEVDGKIIDILAENGELVEYGQPLFVVELN